MKKKLLCAGLITALSLSSMLVMTGCGGEEQPYSDVNLSEYVKVGEYKGLEYDKIAVSVSAKEVQDEIDKRCQAKATTEKAESGTVKDGDTINVSFEGKIDGKTFEGGSSDDYAITIGTTTMIDGFVDGLIGREVGETVTLDLKFPDDYQKEDVAGKDVTFEVKIKTKDVQVVPDYDLDFVKANSDYDNLKDYEASVKKDLLASKQESAEMQVKQALWEEIVDKSEIIKYPDDKDQMIEEQMEAIKKDAEDNEMELDEYLESGGYTEEEFRKALTDNIETNMFQEMLVYAIAEKEGLEVTEDEYQDYIDQVLENTGMDEDTFESAYGMTIEEYMDNQNMKTIMLLNKVMDKVMEYAKEK